MNTYDFDKTIFYPDSSMCFIKFCFTKHPLMLSKTLVKSIGTAVSFFSGQSDTKELKEKLFAFLADIKDLDLLLAEFWKKNNRRISKWYLKQRDDSDVIISASPEFLLEPICNKLNVTLIATQMDRYSGKINGKNCHGAEKVRRFYDKFPDAHTESFYSDSLTDTPMASIADRAFLVRKNKIIAWPK